MSDQRSCDVRPEVLCSCKAKVKEGHSNLGKLISALEAQVALTRNEQQSRDLGSLVVAES